MKTHSHIINVSRMLLLELPWRQNGWPVGYITLLSVISPLKHGVQRLWRLINSLLTMAMLVGPLMGIKDPSKVRSQQVAKSQVVLIINVGRTLILGLPRKRNGCPIGYITLLLVVSQLKCGVQYLWRFIYCLLMMAMLVGLLMFIKEPGKVQNRWVAKSQMFLFLFLFIFLFS